MTKPTPPPVPAPPTEPQYTYCPGCRRRIRPGQSVEAVEHGDPWQSLWHIKCRPVPAPVDVEAVVRARQEEIIALLRSEWPHGWSWTDGAVRELESKLSPIAARSAPVDVALLERVIEEKDMRIAELQRDLDAELEAQDRDINHVALLAQCREALEAADRYIELHTRHFKCSLDWPCTKCHVRAQVRAALLAIKDGTT